MLNHILEIFHESNCFFWLTLWLSRIRTPKWMMAPSRSPLASPTPSPRQPRSSRPVQAVQAVPQAVRWWTSRGETPGSVHEAKTVTPITTQHAGVSNFLMCFWDSQKCCWTVSAGKKLLVMSSKNLLGFKFGWSWNGMNKQNWYDKQQEFTWPARMRCNLAVPNPGNRWLTSCPSPPLAWRSCSSERLVLKHGGIQWDDVKWYAWRVTHHFLWNIHISKQRLYRDVTYINMCIHINTVLDIQVMYIQSCKTKCAFL